LGFSFFRIMTILKKEKKKKTTRDAITSFFFFNDHIREKLVCQKIKIKKIKREKLGQSCVPIISLLHK
jgi:competence protein ComGF